MYIACICFSCSLKVAGCLESVIFGYLRALGADFLTTLRRRRHTLNAVDDIASLYSVCRTECQQATADLRAVTPQMFICACSMKRPEIRDKCARIRSRMTGNTCLGQSMRMRDSYNDKFVERRGHRSLANVCLNASQDKICPNSTF